MQRLDLKMAVMTATGNQVLKGMSPVEPMLDLFVRESIQNSFDALLDNQRTLKEEFNCGKFDYETLSDQFEGISTDLKIFAKMFFSDSFIAVRDYYATGLTGPLKVEDIEENDWGRFLNLVRNFGKSQKAAGSGGSWGYGKTTFYKMGLGLVIYYSRIFVHGEYKERLMACLVENETNKSGLLYRVQQGKNTGIAWWGKLDGEDILPITDHDEIMKVLNCFNYKPYEGDETGTAVIIPFINDIGLLNKTSTGTIKDNNVAPWCYSIEDYLKVSFQRWYPTRCNNTSQNIKGIDAYINGKLIEKNRMRPLFKVVQDLYSISCGDNIISKYEINIENINYIVSPPFNSKLAGRFFYTLLDDDELEMTPPNNEPSPYTAATNERDYDNKKMLICFCRRPGMILKYDNDGDWAGALSSPDPNKYLIGLFVPNSDNSGEINGIRFTIDDYLRASESAEHNNWRDISEYTIYETGKKVDCSKVKLVSLIHRRIKSIFDQLKTPDVIEETTFVGSSLNRKLASLFLPKKGFGNNATPGKELPTKTPKPPTTNRKARVEFSSIKIVDDCFIKEFIITFNKNVKTCSIEFKVSTENSEVPLNEWEKISIIPFTINSIYVEEIIMKNNCEILINSELTNEYSDPYFNYKELVSDLNNLYGFILSTNNDEVSTIKGVIKYKVLDSTIPISINEGNGE